MNRADLIVALGARFDDRVTGNLKAFAPEARFVHVDLDPAERERMMSLTGRRTVPQIFIGDTHVGGCDDLMALDSRGGLVPLLQAAGIEVLEDPEASRKLILPTNQPDVRVVLVRASDVPTYVQYGGADLGVTGLDTLIEHGSQGLYQPLDLKIARCRMSVAVPAGFDYAGAVRQGSRLKVATKYVAIARDFFATKGVHVDMVKLYGSMELAPLTGMADAIVDLVSTGSTLKANQLVEVERIMDISSRLVVNQASLKLKQAPIRRLIDAFAAAINTH